MEALFEKISNSRTLSQEIEGKIESAIRDKKIVAGEKLPTEKELGEMFGVSRTAIREALQMLSARGLVTIRKGSGVFVNTFSPSHASKHHSLYFDIHFDKEYVLHLAHVRQYMEPLNAQLAAKNRTPELLEQIEESLEAFRTPGLGPDELARDDVAFHRNVAEATGNPVISIMMDPVFSLFTKVKKMIIVDLKIQGTSAYDHHKAIFEKIQFQDEEGAFEAMKTHLRAAERDLRLLFRHMNQAKS